MVLTSANLAISYTINGGQPFENSLVVTSMNNVSVDLVGDYTTALLNMYENIDLYKTGLITTLNFVTLQADSVAILQGLEDGLYFLNDFGNKSLNIITNQITDEMINILSLFDTSLSYADSVPNQDNTYALWIQMGSFKDYMGELLTSPETILKIFPSISSQSTTGGTPITRTPIQSVGNVSQQLESVRNNIALLFNNVTNLTAGVAAMESVVTGIYPTTDNAAQIETLRQEITNLEIEKTTGTPEQIILINEQITALSKEITNLQNSGSNKELPSAEVLRIKQLVNAYTAAGSDSLISMTGTVLETSGYPQVPMGNTVPVPTTTPTGTRAERIAQLQASISLIKANQLELNAQYNAAVAAGGLTQEQLNAYRAQTAANTAQIADLEAQINELQTRNNIFTTTWWTGWTRWWNWNSTSGLWSYPSNYIGRYGSTSSSNRKKNLHQTLSRLTTLIEPVNISLPTFQGVVSTMSVIATAQGADAITINYSFRLNDQGWSVVIENFPVYQINQMLANYTRSLTTIPNTQKVNLCKMFGLSTSSVPTQREMTIVFLVAIYSYIACSLFIMKNLEQSGEFISNNLQINALELLNPTALVAMSNSAIPFFSQNSYEDTRIVMRYGILKALTPLLLGGDTLSTLNSSNGLIIANTSELYFRSTA